MKATIGTARSKTDRLNLEQVVSSLNGENPRLTSEDVAALVRFVEAWNKARRNPWKMKMTWDDVTRFSLGRLSGLWESRLAPIGRTPQVERLIPGLVARGIRVKDESDEPGGAYWTQSPNLQGARDTAALCVTMLLTNPLRGKLSDGPCQRNHCGRWFIKRRTLQKCCGSGCLRIIQTAGRIQKQREDAKTDKLKKVRAAQQRWRRRNTKLDWKAWVSKETGLSQKFLTWYVNNGKLRTPHKLSKITPRSPEFPW